MTGTFWFNRLVQYWSIPLNLDLADLVKRARIQVVQAGTFGPQFYGLADDPEVERHWAGMPLIGIRDNLAMAENLIHEIQDAGALFVGQMSMSWHYGDHETGKGLFGAWETVWKDDLLGPPPCPDPSAGQERLADGSLRAWPIEGRPYRAYCGCVCNPHWIATLKPMVSKAIALGMDGLMVHHNFATFCKCDFCRKYLCAHLEQTFDNQELRTIFGTQELEEVEDLFTPHPACSAALKAQMELAVQKVIHRRRKEAFDEIFIDYGRSLKPDLLLAQWYHKYDFKPIDERSLLPNDLWAKDEDYIWYSQGGHKGMSAIRHGYLADMGLPARFTHAAGGGRPFVINKYDSRRLRLSIAEAGANHAAAPAFHWGPQEAPSYILEEYTAPIIRYHRFLADHDALLHPAAPWSQVALVYPRRAEAEGETDALESLKRLGRLMEDDHVLFDIIQDGQILDRIRSYNAVVLPNIRRMSREEGDSVRDFVAAGGNLVIAGETGSCQNDGRPYEKCLFSDWHTQPFGGAQAGIATHGAGRILPVSDTPWTPERVDVGNGITLPLYPLRDQDPFGQAFFADLKRLLEYLWLKTDAPWFVRVRAWRPVSCEAVVLHWVNYQQDEASDIEVPRPVGPVWVDCKTPPGYEVDRVEWRYPEMSETTVLSHTISGSQVQFTIPHLIVYGLSVIYLRKK